MWHYGPPFAALAFVHFTLLVHHTIGALVCCKRAQRFAPIRHGRGFEVAVTVSWHGAPGFSDECPCHATWKTC